MWTRRRATLIALLLCAGLLALLLLLRAPAWAAAPMKWHAVVTLNVSGTIEQAVDAPQQRATPQPTLPHVLNVTVPCARDYCVAGDKTCEDAGADDDEPGATIELLTVLSLNGTRSAQVCLLLETAVRLGYNVTVLESASDKWEATGNIEKLRLFDLYSRMRRAEILQGLGLVNPGGPWTPELLNRLINGTHLLDAVRRRLDARPTHLIASADAFDVYVQLPPRELFRRWRRHWPRSTRLVFSGEANLYPNEPPMSTMWAAERVERGPGIVFPYINAGVWFGTLDGMAELYDAAWAEVVLEGTVHECKAAFWRSDQCVLMTLMGRRNRTTAAHVDAYARVAQSMYAERNFTAATHMGMCTDGRLRRLDVAQTPVFVHYNGVSKKDAAREKGGIDYRLPTSMLGVLEMGWHRRAVDASGTRPSANFNVAFETLVERVRVYDDNMRVVPTGVEHLMRMCASTDLKRLLQR